MRLVPSFAGASHGVEIVRAGIEAVKVLGRIAQTVRRFSSEKDLSLSRSVFLQSVLNH